MTITADSYTVRRADGSTEQGAFSIDTSSKPKKVLFFNWGHKDDPRKAVFELKGKTLRLCMYTKDFGDHNCTAVTPPKVKLPAASDPACGAGRSGSRGAPVTGPGSKGSPCSVRSSTFGGLKNRSAISF